MVSAFLNLHKFRSRNSGFVRESGKKLLRSVLAVVVAENYNSQPVAGRLPCFVDRSDTIHDGKPTEKRPWLAWTMGTLGFTWL
jgi:hypothetical protein